MSALDTVRSATAEPWKGTTCTVVGRGTAVEFISESAISITVAPDTTSNDKPLDGSQRPASLSSAATFGRRKVPGQHRRPFRSVTSDGYRTAGADPRSSPSPTWSVAGLLTSGFHIARVTFARMGPDVSAATHSLAVYGKDRDGTAQSSSSCCCSPPDHRPAADVTSPPGDALCRRLRIQSDRAAPVSFAYRQRQRDLPTLLQIRVDH